MSNDPDDDLGHIDFEDTDLPPLNSLEEYSVRARRHGVIKEGETINRELHALITEVVQQCIDLAIRPQPRYSAAFQIAVTMLPEPFDGPSPAERDLQERRQRYRAERPTTLKHPSSEPGHQAITPLPLPVVAYEFAHDRGDWLVRVTATGEEVYRGPGPVSLHAPFPPF